MVRFATAASNQQSPSSPCWTSNLEKPSTKSWGSSAISCEVQRIVGRWGPSSSRYSRFANYSRMEANKTRDNSGDFWPSVASILCICPVCGRSITTSRWPEIRDPRRVFPSPGILVSACWSPGPRPVVWSRNPSPLTANISLCVKSRCEST